MKQIFIGTLAGLVLLGCKPAMTDKTPNTKTMTSSQNFAATEARLIDALASRNLKLFTVVDHGAGAQSVGADIGTSKLFIFGNPAAGTPIMAAEPTLGLELPMKILVRDSGGDVSLHRTDIAATVRSYGVTEQDGRLSKIDETLTAIMREAAGS